MQLEKILQKYDTILKEEINIKDIVALDEKTEVKKVFKPLGSKLSSKFWKDTGKIIQFGKQGKIKSGKNNQMIVFDDQGNERILEHDEYEIAYEGLEGNDIAIDNEIIAKLDLNITPELAKEGMSREISRFLNQMRKDAKFNVDDKVHLAFHSKDEYLIDVMESFKDFLKEEALLKDISNNTRKPSGEIVAEFVSDEKTMIISLQR